MKYLVVGAGAIGCYLGGRLAAANHDVTFVARPAILTQLKTHGLTITDLDGFKAHLPPQKLHLVNLLDASLISADTVVLLCVKGGATESAVRELVAVCPPNTTVISMQNGVENVQRISRVGPHLDVVAGMVPFNVLLQPGGHVHRGTVGTLYVATSAVTRKLVEPWNAAGLSLSLSADMRRVQWGKLLLNLNNPVNALSDLPLRQQLLDRDFRCVLAALQSEALRALKAARIRPAQIASAPPWLLPFILRLPNFLFMRLAGRMLRMDATARSSMWEDFQQGRTTEIDDLCGAVVRLAQTQGKEAPINGAMCRVIERHHKGQRLSGSELRATLGL